MPILIASGHEFHFKGKNKLTANWICSKNQTHKCRTTAITEDNELIETRGEHNYNISAEKLEAQNVIKHIEDLSERFTPTVAVASAVLQITNDLAGLTKINKLGLKVTDETNHDIAPALKMLPSLAIEKKRKDRRFL